jgi:hypothetical protein
MDNFNFLPQNPNQQQDQLDLDTLLSQQRQPQPIPFQSGPSVNPVMDIYLSLTPQKQPVFMQLLQQNQVCLFNKSNIISGEEFTQKVKILLDPSFTLVLMIYKG